MKKIQFNISCKVVCLIISLLLISIGVLIGFLSFAQGKKLIPKQPVILTARDNAVLYSDGTAEIIWNDDTPDGVMHRYSTKIGSINDPNRGLSLPEIEQTVGSWERIEFIFDDEKDRPCMRHIFYIDRVHKTSNLSSIQNCIVQTLDEHDFKYFLAMSPDYQTMEVGTYTDGKIVARHAVPDEGIASDFHNAGIHEVLPNWEVDKLAFISGGCEGYEQRGLRVYVWDLKNNLIEDRTPMGLTCQNFRGLEYDHGSDMFSVALPWMTDDGPRSLPLRSSPN